MVEVTLLIHLYSLILLLFKLKNFSSISDFMYHDPAGDEY